MPRNRGPLGLDTVTREMTEGLRQAGRETGVDPALIEAWCELGYVVTKTTGICSRRVIFSRGRRQLAVMWIMPATRTTSTAKTARQGLAFDTRSMRRVCAFIAKLDA
jgi:hypothetical protein